MEAELAQLQLVPPAQSHHHLPRGHDRVSFTLGPLLNQWEGSRNGTEFCFAGTSQQWEGRCNGTHRGPPPGPVTDGADICTGSL